MTQRRWMWAAVGLAVVSPVLVLVGLVVTGRDLPGAVIPATAGIHSR